MRVFISEFINLNELQTGNAEAPGGAEVPGGTETVIDEILPIEGDPVVGEVEVVVGGVPIGGGEAGGGLAVPGGGQDVGVVACYSGESTVQTRYGRKTLSVLTNGDEVYECINFSSINVMCIIFSSGTG